MGVLLWGWGKINRENPSRGFGPTSLLRSLVFCAEYESSSSGHWDQGTSALVSSFLVSPAAGFLELKFLLGRLAIKVQLEERFVSLQSEEVQLDSLEPCSIGSSFGWFAPSVVSRLTMLLPGHSQLPGWRDVT